MSLESRLISLESLPRRRRRLSKKIPEGATAPPVTGAAPPRAKLRASVTDIHSCVGARRFASANGSPGQDAQWVDGTEASESLRLYERAGEKRGRAGRALEGKREGKGDWPVPLTSRVIDAAAVVIRHTSRESATRTHTHTHVPVVRRTPDVEARHIHDREREAREDRGDAVVRVIGAPFRGLHNSITPMSVACVALHCGRGAR